MEYIENEGKGNLPKIIYSEMIDRADTINNRHSFEGWLSRIMGIKTSENIITILAMFFFKNGLFCRR